ncbi:MAG: ATP-dependent Clp protease ATP-binding subunit ClpC [Thermoleophilia bacterium]|nr:ATP-dependent Clp protease ATP-binding subunit ClpC [Thermoleophilia bacterium]
MEMTERAWSVIGQARDEARRLGDEHIGTDHLLLAMLRDAQGAAAFVLADFGIDYDAIFARMAGEPVTVA